MHILLEREVCEKGLDPHVENQCFRSRIGKSTKDLTVNYFFFFFGFAGHMVFVITTQLYCYNTEATANHMEYSHKILLRKKKRRAVRNLADSSVNKVLA